MIGTKQLLAGLTATVALGFGTPSFGASLVTGAAYDFDAHDTTVTLKDTSSATNSSAHWYSSVNGGTSHVGHFGGDAVTGFGVDSGTDGIDVSLVSVTSTATTITKAYSFTGAFGDSNDQTMNNNLTQNGNLTWELWINPDDTGADEQIIYEDGGAGTGIAIWYDNVNNLIKFTIANGDTETVNAGITAGDFSHVVATYSTTGDMNIFVNTTGGTTANTTGGWNGADFGGIGERGQSSVADDEGLDNNSGAFEGDIAVLRIYGKVLTSEEITTSYNQYAVPEPGSLALLGLGGLLVARRRRD